MKKIIYFLSGISAMFALSCEPQMDVAPDIGSPPTGEIAIEVIDANNLHFSSTENWLYFWNFNGAAPVSFEQEFDAYFPFKGDYQVELTLPGKGGATLIKQDFEILSNDPDVGQQPVLKELTGEGLGKTWVYAIDHPDGYYFYMTADYDWEEYWWSPVHDDGEDLAGIDNEIKFDLDGGYNYTFYSDESAVGVEGSFVIDTENMTIKIANPYIPDYNNGNLNPKMIPGGNYDIKLLTDDEMILWQNQADLDFDYGWIWVFKRKGYIYSFK